MRVDRLVETYAIDVEIKHFPLHPETPTEGRTLEELFAGRNMDLVAAQRKMARLMAAEGLPYGERTMTYNSRLAQEFAAWAVALPGGEEVHDEIFRAYFVDGTNLALIENLVPLAEKLGLDPDRARQVLDTRSHRAIVDRDWERSSRLGVTGVPTFVVGDQGLVGAQPYEVLEAFLIDRGARRR